MLLVFLDLCEPSYADVVRGIIFVRACLASKQGSHPGGRVFVHCKAGRGRSALFSLCYLLSSSYASPSVKRRSNLEFSPAPDAIGGVPLSAKDVPTTTTTATAEVCPRPEEVFQLLKSRRAVVESHILTSRVLSQFVDGLQRHRGDMDEMLRDALVGHNNLDR
jgi:hypothetical protein